MRLFGRDISVRPPVARTDTAPGVVVASFGRSGSTLLYEALVKAARRRRNRLIGVPRVRRVGRVAWDLGETPLEEGFVYKTHDYPDALRGRRDLRTVFIFGQASQAVLSVLHCREAFGADWIAEHMAHLKAPGRFEDILEADILGLEAQMKAWSGFSESPVLCLRYEALWAHQAEIRDFTGLAVSLPPRRARTPKDFPLEVIRQVAGTYGPLDARIARLPDIFRAGAGFDELFG